MSELILLSLCVHLEVLQMDRTHLLKNIWRECLLAAVRAHASLPYKSTDSTMPLKTAALACNESLQLVRTGFFSAPKILLAAVILAVTSALSVAVESMLEPGWREIVVWLLTFRSTTVGMLDSVPPCISGGS